MLSNVVGKAATRNHWQHQCVQYKRRFWIIYLDSALANIIFTSGHLNCINTHIVICCDTDSLLMGIPCILRNKLRETRNWLQHCLMPLDILMYNVLPILQTLILQLNLLVNLKYLLLELIDFGIFFSRSRYLNRSGIFQSYYLLQNTPF